MEKLNKSEISLGDKPFITLLEKLPKDTVQKLFEHSAPCMALFGQLPELAKHYVMRLLFIEQSISKSVVASWSSAADESKEAIETLVSLNIIAESSVVGGLSGWILNNRFRQSLKTSLLGGGEPWVVHRKVLDKDKYYKGIEFLDQYATERWSFILNFMTGYKPTAAEANAAGGEAEAGGDEMDRLKVPPETMMTLKQGNLITFPEHNDDDVISPTITSDGFQFLLMDAQSQVWYFLQKYLIRALDRNLDVVELTNFLCQISFLTLGKDYSTDGLVGDIPDFLQSLREFGLIYQRKRKAGRFYPTRLATHLFNNVPSATNDDDRTGYIIVETNYRVYAYTTSPLQISLLAFFTELQYHFPNMILGVITRESVREALRNGITAEQIINFLKLNAHAELIRTRPTHIIPPTVEDQIRLWEMERDRFTFRDGYMYEQFNSQADFDTLRNYANELGVITFENPASRVVIVTLEGHEEVRKFWKRYKRDG